MSSAARSQAAPVLALFRSILRLHRQRLPPPMRAMGDTYVRDEFSRHLKGKTTQEQWRVFVAEWQHYHDMLAGNADILDAAAAAVDGGGGGAPGAGATALAAAATTTAEAASGSCGELSQGVLEAMTPDQRARLARLREEAGRFGRELLTPEGGAAENGGDGDKAAQEQQQGLPGDS